VLKSFVLKTKRGFKGPLAAGGQWGSGADPSTLCRFYSFYQKNLHSLDIVWSKFPFFKWLNKVLMQLMQPQGLRPRARAPSPLPYYITIYAKAKTVHLLSLLCYSILILKAGCIAFQCWL